MAKEPDQKIKRVLVSVSDKTGLTNFCLSLVDYFGVEIISTGGTLKSLLESNIEATEVSSYTGFPEMMDGRVKTLHPRVHGGILARRDLDKKVMEEKEEANEMNIKKIKAAFEDDRGKITDII